MSKKVKQVTYEEALAWLRRNGFDVIDAPGTHTDRVFLKKYGCSAAIEKAADGTAKIFAFPGVLIAGEIAKMVDKGFQKFLKTSKVERAVMEIDLTNLHSFSEELKEATGATSLYNESLGSTGEFYQYDRVKDRDLEESARPVRPWEEEPKKKHA